MPESAKWHELNDRIARLSVTESSRDGTVQVTVSTTGVLTGLVLKERWQQPQPAGAVAAQIMECLARAQARIPNLLGQAVFETIGPNVPAAELVVADARKRFPEPPPPAERQPQRAEWQPPPQAEWQPPAPRSPRQPDRVDDDWDGRTVMEDGP